MWLWRALLDSDNNPLRANWRDEHRLITVQRNSYMGPANESGKHYDFVVSTVQLDANGAPYGPPTAHTCVDWAALDVHLFNRFGIPISNDQWVPVVQRVMPYLEAWHNTTVSRWVDLTNMP